MCSSDLVGRVKRILYTGLPYLGITGIPGLGIAGIPELGIAGIPELGIIQIVRLAISSRFYIFIVFFTNEVEKKDIGDLRPLYLTTKTLRIFSTWSFELGTSHLQNFARSCVKKLGSTELEKC
mgnify:CR=1 FL=1